MATRTKQPQRRPARSVTASSRSTPKGSTAKRAAGAYVAIKARPRASVGAPPLPGGKLAVAAAIHHHRKVKARRAVGRSTAPAARTRPTTRATSVQPRQRSGGGSGKALRGVRSVARKATGGGHGFRSRAEWRWAYATDKSWAHKTAHERSWKSLPARKGPPRTAR